MRITRLEVSNWRNFKSVDIPMRGRLVIVGPNAAGKSNFLDIFRFLADIAADGGLASAIERRGGFSKVRSLFARSFKGGRIVIRVSLEDENDTWVYELSVKSESRGKHRPVVDAEVVTRNGEEVFRRPDSKDQEDPERLTQTYLEQIVANRDFRPLAEYFGSAGYSHLVPQVIRDPSRHGGAAKDPFGSDFIAQMNSEIPQRKKAWMKRVQRALQSAVPEFETLEIIVDSAGRPHLQAGYRNWRANPTKHSETDFSDGTLRLIGILWTIISRPTKSGVLLLEEPELSLNAAIVGKLPTVFASAQRERDMQIVISTHSPEILHDEGLHADEIVVLRVTDDGTHAELLSNIPEVEGLLEADLDKSEIVQSLVNPPDLHGLVAAARGSK